VLNTTHITDQLTTAIQNTLLRIIVQKNPEDGLLFYRIMKENKKTPPDMHTYQILMGAYLKVLQRKERKKEKRESEMN
jgi:hypothetical protein